MRVVILTPFFPPDIEPSALYAKELARRMPGSVVVAYALYPECVPNANIIAIPKNLPRSLRIFFFTIVGCWYAAGAHVIALNGPSVDITLKVILFFASKVTRLHADTRCKKEVGMIDIPRPRPEIHPLNPHPTEALVSFEAAWRDHLQKLDV